MQKDVKGYVGIEGASWGHIGFRALDSSFRGSGVGCEGLI